MMVNILLMIELQDCEMLKGKLWLQQSKSFCADKKKSFQRESIKINEDF